MCSLRQLRIASRCDASGMRKLSKTRPIQTVLSTTPTCSTEVRSESLYLPQTQCNFQFFLLFLSEIRTHGVAYYQFNKDHTSREEQIEALKQLREQVRV